MDKKELEESNRSKYGNKSEDLIAHCYKNGRDHGDFWCLINIRRYVDRYFREGSSKAKNLTDLLKSQDYLERALEQSGLDFETVASSESHDRLKELIFEAIDDYLFYSGEARNLASLKYLLNRAVLYHEGSINEIIE